MSWIAYGIRLYRFLIIIVFFSSGFPILEFRLLSLYQPCADPENTIIKVFHRRPYRRVPIAFGRRSVQEFIRKHLITCGFPGVWVLSPSLDLPTWSAHFRLGAAFSLLSKIQTENSFLLFIKDISPLQRRDIGFSFPCCCMVCGYWSVKLDTPLD